MGPALLTAVALLLAANVLAGPGDAPLLVNALSRKSHGTVPFDLPLSLNATTPTTEPRSGPAQTIVFVFDKPVTAGLATVTLGTATAGAPAFSGNEMIVPLTGVANQQYVHVVATEVAAADGGADGRGAVLVGFLLGYVSQNRVVTVSDLAQVNAQIAQVVTATNYLKDVNASGTLTVADKGIANTQITKALPAAPVPANQAPQVSTGPDQTIALPAGAALSGAVSDDGLPAPPGQVTLTWSTDSGPGTVTFADAHAKDTSATFAAAGTYVLRLTASDGSLSGFATVVVTVQAAAGGEVTVDKISLATFPGAQETITVSATDAAGAPVGWTAWSDNGGIATALVVGGTMIQVTGVAPGRTHLTVLSDVGVQRSLPLRVYDPRVLGVGVRLAGAAEIVEELQIKYVDQFTCRWTDAHAGAVRHASFYHPANLTDGWKALGSLGVKNALQCPVVNGQQWMMVVRANPDQGDPHNPPLKPPVGFAKEWDDAGTGGDVMFGAFWTPLCPDGYVAMGTVVTGGSTSAGRNPPPLTDAACIRRDLTVPATATATIWNDEGTGGDVKFQGSFSMAAPSNTIFDETTAYLTTGAFVTRGQLRSCPDGPSCWLLPAPGSHDVMNVLAVDLPMLIDTPQGSWYPRLTDYDPPPVETEPLMAKAMLVPFTAVGFGTDYGARTLSWMVNNSPFVRTERLLRWKLLEGMHMYNGGSVPQEMSTTITKGVSTEDTTSMSHTAGVEITGEGGVKFLGTGGSISATVSYQFGYQTQTSVAEFYSTEKTVTVTVPPYKSVAAWVASSNILVKVHNLLTRKLESVHNIDMGDSVSHTIDEYPD
jgi:hypothetical protein